MRLRSLAIIAAVTLGTVMVPFGATAEAQSGSGDAKIRLAHFSPDANGVDVYIDGKKRMNRVPYQAVGDYISLPAGKHNIELRAEGEPETSPSLVSASPELTGGESFTAAALGSVANIQLKVFADDLTPPARGKTKVRVIHSADGTSTVDIAIKDGDVLFPGVAFGSITTYQEVAAGPYVLQVRKAGETAVVIEKPVTVQPGGIYTIAAVGGADKPTTLRGFVDLVPGANAAAGATTASTAAAGATDTKVPDTTATASTKPAPTTAAPSTTNPATTKPAATVPPTKAPITPTTQPAPVGGATSVGSAGTGGKGTKGGNGTTSGNAKTPGATKPGAAAVAPVGGASTGFGGLSDTSSAMSILAMGVAMLAMVIAGLRRRNARSY